MCCCMRMTFFHRNFFPILGCIFQAAASCKPENTVVPNWNRIHICAHVEKEKLLRTRMFHSHTHTHNEHAHTMKYSFHFAFPLTLDFIYISLSPFFFKKIFLTWYLSKVEIPRILESVVSVVDHLLVKMVCH